jgi:hypothetical protein
MPLQETIELALGHEAALDPSSHSQDTPTTRTASPFSSPQFRAILSGMVSKGHGIDAICLFLTLTREVLLDLVVQLDLPTPHDMAYRRYGGARAWTPADYGVLMAGYLGNWTTACIAERIGRSRGSIWAKARRLGLPKRDRRSLVWPKNLARLETKPVDVPRPETPQPTASPSRLPLRWFVKGTATPLELTSKRNGREVHWTTHALIELGMRKWGAQHIHAIAKDFGVSLRAVTSQLNWLEIPPRPRSEQTERFERATAEANIAAAGYKLVFCKTNGRFPYWTKRRAMTNSKRDTLRGLYSGCFA